MKSTLNDVQLEMSDYQEVFLVASEDADLKTGICKSLTRKPSYSPGEQGQCFDKI